MSKEVFDAVAQASTCGETSLLRRVLRSRDVESVRREVAFTARFHLVNGLMGSAITADPIGDEPLTKYFRAHQERATLHHLRTMADLSWAQKLFDDAGVAWAVLKGPFLVEHCYGRIDVRAYNDLDVLVDRHRFGDALDVLESAGARLADRNWPLIASSGRGELSLVLPHGTLLDLHWHLIVDRHVRTGFRIEVDDVLENRRYIGSGQTRMPALGVGDAWFHTALHAVLTGGDRILWAVDLERLLTADGTLRSDDWARAQRFGWAGAGAIAADLVATLFPHRAADAGAAPKSLWRSVRQTTLCHGGLNRTLDCRFSTKVVTTSVRRSGLASVTALAAVGWDQAIKGPIANRDHPWRQRRRGEQAMDLATSALKVDSPIEPFRSAFLRSITS